MRLAKWTTGLAAAAHVVAAVLLSAAAARAERLAAEAAWSFNTKG